MATIDESQYKRARLMLADGSAPSDLKGELEDLVKEYDDEHHGEHATLGAAPQIAESRPEPTGIAPLVQAAKTGRAAGLPGRDGSVAAASR